MCATLPAQLPDVSFRYLDFRDGLPEYTFSQDIIQDHFGRIWIGTEKGLFRYDGYEVVSFSPDIQDSTALTEVTIQALYLHTDNTIWIGTRNMGICIFDPEYGTFRRYLPVNEEGPVPSGRIWGFYPGKNGILWISSEDGLIRCETQTMTFRKFIYQNDQLTDEDLQYLNTLREISVDPENPHLLWLCTRSGLLTFDTQNEQFTRYPMPYSSKEVGLESREYMLIQMEWTSTEDIWLSSWAGGIFHLNKKTRKWNRYRNSSIQTVDNIGFALLRQNDRDLWYATRNGFGIFNTQNKSFSFFNNDREERGGLKWCHQYNSCIITTDGSLVVGGTLGLSISEKPVQDINDTDTIKPIISAIHLDHNPLQTKKSNEYVSEIIIKESGSSLSFTCAYPVYQNVSDVHYRFKLAGYDNDWTDYNTARKVQYTNLRPGSYRFHYAVSNNGQHWIEGSTAPFITVERPIWLNPFFLSGLGILILGTLGFIYNMRISHIKTESRLKEDFNKKLAENEMTALRAQMNPHFMFNSLNSIKNYILKENTDKASRYLTKFSQLMRAILKNSQSKLISLEDELHALKLYIEIEAMRFNEAFTHSIEVDEVLNPSKLYIPPLLIQPYVENAIWHGLMLKEGEKLLRLKIFPNNGHLLITIEDNGIGRKQAVELKTKDNRKNRSYGMQITRDRIELINWTLAIDARVTVEDLTHENGEPSGTKVHIYVPRIDEESYAATWER